MSDHALVAAAVAAVLCAVVAPAVPPAAALAFVALALVARRPEPLLVALVLLVGARAHASLEALDRPLPARLDGEAELVGDPEPGRFGSTAVVRLDGRRYLAVFGRDDESAVRGRLTGDRLVLDGRVGPLREVPEGWRRSRHLAGRLTVGEAGPGPPASPWFRLANGVHRVLARGADSLEPGARSLYLGLVIGDDRAQDDLDRFRFRASGLGHLLAVSGQNVAFVLLVAAPVLDRLPLRPRLAVALAALVVFVLVTRAEPSVLRAAGMAAVALAAATAGRVASGARVLALTVLGLLVVDPLLAEAVGFRLSLGATVGLLVLCRPLAERLPVPGPLALPLAATLAAQVGTAPFLLPLSGGLPAVAVPANLLAVPAAGAVMTLGLSVGLVAGLVRPELASVLQIPSRVLVSWVDGVATVASRVPTAPIGVGRLLVLVGAVAAVWLLSCRLVRARAPTVTSAVAALVLVALALPAPLGPGRYPLGGEATLSIDPCGRRAVTLGPGADALDVLDGLWHLGVTSVDAVVGAARDPIVGLQIADQLDAATAAARPEGAPPFGAGGCPGGGVASRP